ncbi:MAG: hypothetical protein Q4F24_16170, partial [Eubacteriales bacterium]|nr:hypothetical protein [Eubacteriales bacterium]
AKQENQQVDRTSGEIALDTESLPCANGCSEAPSQTLPFESVLLTRKVVYIQPYKQEFYVRNTKRFRKQSVIDFRIACNINNKFYRLPTA